jgi:hypothetical protein
VECGIIISNNEGYNQKQTVSNTEEEQLVTISGLEPFTEYTCTPYVSLTKSEGGVYYKEGIGLTFKTLPPDISGTWNCKETYYTVSGNPGYNYYTITLHKDGKVSTSKYSDLATSNWIFSSNGQVNINIMTIATNTFNSGREWVGTVNDIKNPTAITGYTYNWNFNQYGYYEGNSNQFELTR